MVEQFLEQASHFMDGLHNVFHQWGAEVPNAGIVAAIVVPFVAYPNTKVAIAAAQSAVPRAAPVRGPRQRHPRPALATPGRTLTEPGPAPAQDVFDDSDDPEPAPVAQALAAAPVEPAVQRPKGRYTAGAIAYNCYE